MHGETRSVRRPCGVRSSRLRPSSLLSGTRGLTALDQQELFIRLPRALRKSIVFAQSAYNRASRYGSAYKNLSEILEASQYWDAERMAAFQAEQLQRLLIEAKHSTRYYAEAFREFSDASLSELGARFELSRLPLLQLSVLKARTAEFFNRSRRRFNKSSTSGSTGSPLVVEYDRVSVQQRFAHVHRLRSWGGVRPFDRLVRMSGRLLARPETEQKPWFTTPFEPMLLVSTYHLREPYLARILQKILEYRPALIDGYPSAIEQLARYATSVGTRIPSLRMVVTTAETLSQESRELMERAFGVKVFDYYSASEGVPLIGQCEFGTYHVCAESGLFEFLRQDGSPAAPGELAEIVVTSFCQWRTPLIRYCTGDVVTLSSSPSAPCACGRTLPSVGRIVGRVDDLVVTRDGRAIGMFPFRTLKYVAGIREAQIVQTSDTEFLVRLALDETRAITEVELDLTRVFSIVVGYPVRVRTEQVDAIPRGPNGKFRTMIRSAGSA